MRPDPFISVVTPVYNGESYLADAIESVLRQDYSNWEYIIVNNCSTDGTLALAEDYAGRDRRIRVVSNDVFVDCEANHNNAFRQISARSEYCKVVSADDWLLPGCLRKMVRLAVEHPSVGIVGSYQQHKDIAIWKGLPESVSVLSGREACRLALLQGVHVFGNPVSVLYRSDLIRRTNSFFPHSRAHADTSACYEALSDCDFGFVHEALSVDRVHPGRITSRIERLDAGTLAYIEILLHYGPRYLDKAEFLTRRDELIDEYYRMLGGRALHMRGKGYWDFQRESLEALGYRLDRRRVAKEAIRKIVGGIMTLGSRLRYLSA